MLGLASLTPFPGPDQRRVIPRLASSPIPDTCLNASFLPVQPCVPSTSGLFHFGNADGTAGCYWCWNSLLPPQELRPPWGPWKMEQLKVGILSGLQTLRKLSVLNASQ